MNIYFTVDNPKIDKRGKNRGEDAPPVNKDGIMIICDGTGATGQSEHMIDNEIYTSAYLGSRVTSKIAGNFLSVNYERMMEAFADIDEVQRIVAELGEEIRNGLKEYVKENRLELTVHGKSFKLLPTTFTAVVYQLCECGIEAIVLNAGDSKVLWWDAYGLHQLSVEGNENIDSSFGDCRVNNCVSADSDFSISFSCYRLPMKGILLACSDGFTDAALPFEQERYLIEWIGNFEEISEECSAQLSQEIACEMDKVGFTKRDDCSMAGIIAGYSSEEELKDEFRKRYKTKLVDAYLIPYKKLKTQYREIENTLYEAQELLRKSRHKIVRIIKAEICNYIDSYNCDDPNEDTLFQNLVHTDAISREIWKENHLIEQERQEKQADCVRKELELREDYLQFLETLCRYYGSVRFPEEIVFAVQTFNESRTAFETYLQGIKKDYLVLRSMAEVDTDNYEEDFWDDFATITSRMTVAAERVSESNRAYQKTKRIIEQYFDYSNDKVREFFEEDFESEFAILKKCRSHSILGSKKFSELKSACNRLCNLRGEIDKIKNRTSEEFIANRKLKAYKRIIRNSCEDIASELFYQDKYQGYMYRKQEEIPIPEVRQCECLKKELEETIAQREKLLNAYNLEYHRYLIDRCARGKGIFRKGE